MNVKNFTGDPTDWTSFYNSDPTDWTSVSVDGKKMILLLIVSLAQSKLGYS